MDWSDIGSAVKTYAPIVGEALTSPIGAAMAVGQVVANLFGVKSTPDDVMDYIKGNSEKAQERLQFELSNNIEFQKLCLSKIQEQNRHDEYNAGLIISDKQSARQNSENINKSPVDNKIKMIIVISEISLFVMCISIIAYYHDNLNSSLSGIIGTVIGMILKSLTTIIDFYWGSAFDKLNDKNK